MMKKIVYILPFILLASCTPQKVVKTDLGVTDDSDVFFCKKQYVDLYSAAFEKLNIQKEDNKIYYCK